jgi:hypothetical protein
VSRPRALAGAPRPTTSHQGTSIRPTDQNAAKNDDDFRAKIAHTLNDLGAMTASARRTRTEGAAAEEETPEEPTPDEG